MFPSLVSPHGEESGTRILSNEQLLVRRYTFEFLAASVRPPDCNSIHNLCIAKAKVRGLFARGQISRLAPYFSRLLTLARDDPHFCADRAVRLADSILPSDPDSDPIPIIPAVVPQDQRLTS